VLLSSRIDSKARVARIFAYLKAARKTQAIGVQMACLAPLQHVADVVLTFSAVVLTFLRTATLCAASLAHQRHQTLFAKRRWVSLL